MLFMKKVTYLFIFLSSNHETNICKYGEVEDVVFMRYNK